MSIALADALPVRLADRRLEALRAFVSDLIRYVAGDSGAVITTHAQIAIATGRSIRTVERLIPAAEREQLVTYSPGLPAVGTYGRRSGRLVVHAAAVRAWATELHALAAGMVAAVAERVHRGRDAAARLIRNPDAFVASRVHRRRKPTRHGDGSPPGEGGGRLSTGAHLRTPRPWEDLETCEHDSLLGRCGTCRRFQALLTDEAAPAPRGLNIGRATRATTPRRKDRR